MRAMRALIVVLMMLLCIDARAQYQIQKVDVVKWSTGTVSVSMSTGTTIAVSTPVITSETRWRVNATTYVVVRATATGTTSWTMDADSVSCWMLDGTGSGEVRLNGGSYVPIRPSVGYMYGGVGSVRMKNPTIGYTLTSGTMCIVIEGVSP
jgi:hypothetical protein